MGGGHHQLMTSGSKADIVRGLTIAVSTLNAFSI